jgi:hypothetical protein
MLSLDIIDKYLLFWTVIINAYGLIFIQLFTKETSFI